MSLEIVQGVQIAQAALAAGVFTLSVVSGVPEIRRKLLTRPLIKSLGKQLPTISPTEQVALDSGKPWFDGELLQGNPNWDSFLRLSWAHLTKEERQFLDGPVETLCKMLDDWKIHEDKNLPPEVWSFLRANKFFGLRIEKEHGGLGFSPFALYAMVEKVASRSATAAVTVMVPNSLGPGELIQDYGTAAQKEYYLPLLASGRMIPCFGLTSEDAGSDAGGITDSGRIGYGSYTDPVTGKTEYGVGLWINCSKRYITLAPVADLVGLAIKVDDPDRILGGDINKAFTLVVVPANTPGLEIGNRTMPLNSPFMNGPVRAKDMFVPLSCVIGGEDGIGQGWRMIMECLSKGRALCLPALSAAVAKIVSRLVGAMSEIRKQFNLSIGKFQGVEEMLATVAMHTYMIDAAATMGAAAVERGEVSGVVAAILKYHTTEMMRIVANLGMDIIGGKGIIMGPLNFMAALYDAVPIGITVEGSNPVTRYLMIMGQGLVRCHRYVLPLVKTMSAYSENAQSGNAQSGDATANAEAAAREKEILADFEQLLARYSLFVVQTVVRNVAGNTLQLPIFNVPKGVAPEVKRYYRNFGKMSAALALLAEATLIFIGGDIKRQECLSARLGDVLSHLFIGASVLRRFHESQNQGELPIVQGACEHSLWSIGVAIGEFLDNFPNRVAAAALKVIVFPFGVHYKRPSFRKNHQMAEILLKPSEVRDLLTAGIYLPGEDDPLGAYDKALVAVIAAEPIDKKIQKAVKQGIVQALRLDDRATESCNKGIISLEELAIWREARYWSQKCIRVDEFSTINGGSYGTIATPTVKKPD